MGLQLGLFGEVFGGVYGREVYWCRVWCGVIFGAGIVVVVLRGVWKFCGNGEKLVSERKSGVGEGVGRGARILVGNWVEIK